MAIHPTIPWGVAVFSTHHRQKLFAFAGLVLSVSLPVVLIIVLRAEFVRTPLAVGEQAPKLQLLSLHNQTPVQLGEGGQIVLFFTVECPHCQNAMLNFEVLHRRYGKQARFLAVSLSERQKTMEYVQAKGYAFPVALDEEKNAKDAYRIVRVPALLLIDGGGILHTRRSGEASLQADEQLLLTFLKETTKSHSQ